MTTAWKIDGSSEEEQAARRDGSLYAMMARSVVHADRVDGVECLRAALDQALATLDALRARVQALETQLAAFVPADEPFEMHAENVDVEQLREFMRLCGIKEEELPPGGEIRTLLAAPVRVAPGGQP